MRIDDGQLVLEGVDAGKFVGDVWGTEDYEFSETVPAAWRDTVLLHLMAERFDKTSDFKKWCALRHSAWPGPRNCYYLGSLLAALRAAHCSNRASVPVRRCSECY